MRGNITALIMMLNIWSYGPQEQDGIQFQIKSHGEYSYMIKCGHVIVGCINKHCSMEMSPKHI